MKDMIKRIREEREGFTLAELLIVVAIIAVLVAIAIPVFNSQLEKSREATDAANIRAAYAEVMAAAVSDSNDSTLANNVTHSGTTYSKEVTLVQKTAGWTDNSIKLPENLEVQNNGTPQPEGKATISYNTSNNTTGKAILTYAAATTQP